MFISLFVHYETIIIECWTCSWQHCVNYTSTTELATREPNCMRRDAWHALLRRRRVTNVMYRACNRWRRRWVFVDLPSVESTIEEDYGLAVRGRAYKIYKFTFNPVWLLNFLFNIDYLRRKELFVKIVVSIYSECPKSDYTRNIHIRIIGIAFLCGVK